MDQKFPTYGLLDWIERNNPEWDRMWQKLGENPFNAGSENPTVCENLGECWQYMGTEFVGNEQGKKWMHCFRHRCHPKTNKRQYLWIEDQRERRD